MKRSNLLKGISTAVVAFALCLGFTGTVQAAQLDKADVVQAELTQVGAPAAPQISINRTIKSGDTITGWEISYPKVPQGYILVFNVYANGNRKDSVNGNWVTDDNNVEYFEPNGYDWDYDWDYFPATDSRSYHVYTDNSYAKSEYDSTTLTIDSDDFEPGTYNIEAYLYQYVWNKVTETDEWGTETYWSRVGDPSYSAEYRSVASADLSFTASLAAPSVDTAIKSTSVQLNMSRGNATGYEVYRKIGKKFVKVANTTKATYTDNGLISDTTYQYKVRAYYYNAKTKNTVYSAYTPVECTTNGSALKLKATLTGKKNVKLTWNKVPGAIRYEVYRYRATSTSTEISKGYYNGYSSKNLLKTLGKGKKSYTDKKTTVNDSYTYLVVAVLKGGKQSVLQSITVGVSFGTPSVRSYTDKNGKKTIEWDKVYGADGYLLERYDAASKNWVTAQKLTKTKTKVTLSFAAYQDATTKNWVTSQSYRLRATKGTVVSDYFSFSVNATLGVVSSVTAKKVANGIQVSWSAVPGATFYRVYRVKAGAHILYKDSNSYNVYGEQVTEYIGVVAPQVMTAVAGDTTTRYYRNYSDSRNYTTALTMLDYAGDVISWDGASKPTTVGPQEGITYQYYVVACAAQTLDTNKNYSVYNTTTHEWTQTEKAQYGVRTYFNAGALNEWYNDNDGSSLYTSMGCKKGGEATYTSVAAPGKAKISSLKAAKKSVTVKIKKVSGATGYKIYRATKKKGKYMCVGTSTKVTFKDTGLKAGTTYYYKVVAITKAESGADIEGKASAVKSVKAK